MAGLSQVKLFLKRLPRNEKKNHFTNSWNWIALGQIQRKMCPRKLSKREWLCFYCKEAGKQNMQSFTCSTVDEVHNHWKLYHSHDDRDGNDTTKPKQPFRFYLADLLYCSMDSCWYFSKLQGLHAHHMKTHPNDRFVAILNGRCAMCLYSGNNLYEHDCAARQKVMELKLHNPVLLTDQDLAELQAIECKYNRRQRIECHACGGIFTTMQKLNQHRCHQQHGYETVNFSLKIYL